MPQEFTLPGELKLTGGQTYHWAVEVVQNGIENVKTGHFKIPLAATGGNDTFSSVTVLTNGVDPGNTTDTSESINDIARQIEAFGGSVMRYEPNSQEWESVFYSQGSGEWNSTNKPPELGKPLVLLADWVDESDIDGYQTAGLAEAAADGLFSSLVDFDLDYGGTVGGSESLYDQNGDLIRSQGAVFNSPLHFIGFGQGAVVNTEIVQRLGTYFPNAGGRNAQNRDLHFTTVDPFEYNPETVSGSGDFEVYGRMLDPKIVIWNNVTYADNYYQQQVPEGDEKVIRGKPLTEADHNQELEKWAGFDSAKESDHPHRAAVSWYAGTANLNESHVSDEKQQVFRRLGDLLAEGFSSDDNDKSWFVPGHVKADFAHGDENAPWEGIGTGWFYSVNGGGKDLRPYFVNGEKKSRGDLGNFDEFQEYLKKNRRSVSDDNTYTGEDVGNRLRGDFAVPTLFNGNFDVVAPDTVDSDQPLAGWSYTDPSSSPTTNSSSSPTINNLVDWKQITSLKKPFTYPDGKKIPGTSFLDRMGISSDPNYRPNYALKLEGGDSITHNPFIVPDWGILRFNLHVPETELKKNGIVNVSIKAEVEGYENYKKIGTVELEAAKGSGAFYQEDTQRVDYGTRGFETFHVNIPDELRGKLAKLKFEVSGADKPQIFLDDTFFQSLHLRFGAPKPKSGNPDVAARMVARYSDAMFESNPYQDRLLLERPQYTLSYNGINGINIPNWGGFQINKSWISIKGTNNKSEPTYDGSRSQFIDRVLIDRGFYSVPDKGYKNAPENYNKGHLTPISSRNRNNKDSVAVNIMSNFVPQHDKNNIPIWKSIEEYANDFAKNGKEVYIFTGPDKSKGTFQGNNTEVPPQNISIPEKLWKVMLVIDRPYADVKNTPVYAVGFYLDNDDFKDEGGKAIPWLKDWRKKWKNWDENPQDERIVWSIKEVEEETGYEFFPGFPPEVKEQIENTKYIFSKASDIGKDWDRQPWEI